MKDRYYCPFNRATVEGIRPSENSNLLLVLDPTQLPDKDLLVLEDVQGMRYRRVMLPVGGWLFERL